MKPRIKLKSSTSQISTSSTKPRIKIPVSMMNKPSVTEMHKQEMKMAGINPRTKKLK